MNREDAGISADLVLEAVEIEGGGVAAGGHQGEKRDGEGQCKPVHLRFLPGSLLRVCDFHLQLNERTPLEGSREGPE